MDLAALASLTKAALPLWILTGGGLLCLLVESLSFKRSAEAVCGVAFASLAASLSLAYGQWSSGFTYSQNYFKLDAITLFFTLLMLFIGMVSLLNFYSYLVLSGKMAENDLNPKAALPGGVVTLLIFSIVGGIFMFATDHLILNFVGLEILSVSIYILVGFNKKDPRSNEGAMKYFVMGSVASAVLLYGVALLYASLGTLELSKLAAAVISPQIGYLPYIGVILVLAGLFFKLSLVPFHFWAPDVYEGAPTPVTGFMATGVKVAAFALFIRVLLSFQFVSAPILATILSVVVGVTMVVGNLAAILQDNVKRMLAYSSIAHAGYALFGLLVGFKDGRFDSAVVSMVLFYLMSYSVMTLGAFAVLGSLVSKDGERMQFADLAGLGYKRPGIALALSIFLISMLGIPPTVGFFAKYGIFATAVRQGYLGLAILGMLTSLVSAYYYLRPIVLMYFGSNTEESKSPSLLPIPLMFAVVFCAAAVIYLGIQPTHYLQMAQAALVALVP